MRNKNKWFPYGLETNTRKMLRLFCFPYAGGSSKAFRAWVNASETVDIVPVELPGRGGHISEPSIESIDQLIEAFLPQLLAAANGHPFMLYGHSLGAMIAFQLAFVLQERSYPCPDKIIVAGRHAPHHPDPSRLNSSMNEQEMKEEIRRLNGTPKELFNSPEMVEFFLNFLKSDLKLHESFNYYGQTLNIPIIAHCGEKDEEAGLLIMSYWQERTRVDFSIQEFPGNHFFVQSLGTEYFNVLKKTIVEETSPGELARHEFIPFNQKQQTG
jgi:medium-chain acyl-[acyl-carrier-protein] hydrolase